MILGTHEKLPTHQCVAEKKGFAGVKKAEDRNKCNRPS